MPWMNIAGHGDTGATGTYQYDYPGPNPGPYSGTVRIVDTPNVGVEINNYEATFSGSELTVSGTIVNNNNFAVKDLWVMWDSGTGSVWPRTGNDAQAYSATIPAGGTGTFSETMCCGSGVTATPYLFQVFREDGTPMIDVDVNPGSTQVTQLTIDSFEVFEEGSQTRYTAVGDAPASTDLTLTMTKPDGSDGDYNGGSSTGGPAYNHGGLISPTSSLMYGTWTFEICAPAYDMCVQESFTINSPSIDVSVPNDITITAGSPILNTQNFPPTATDDVDGNLTVTCNSGGDTFPAINGWGPTLDSVGVHSITCSATNSAGHTGTASFTITVEEAPLSNVDLISSSLTPDATTYPDGAGTTS